MTTFCPLASDAGPGAGRHRDRHVPVLERLLQDHLAVVEAARVVDHQQRLAPDQRVDARRARGCPSCPRCPSCPAPPVVPPRPAFPACPPRPRAGRARRARRPVRPGPRRRSCPAAPVVPARARRPGRAGGPAGARRADRTGRPVVPAEPSCRPRRSCRPPLVPAVPARSPPDRRPFPAIRPRHPSRRRSRVRGSARPEPEPGESRVEARPVMGQGVSGGPFHGSRRPAVLWAVRQRALRNVAMTLAAPFRAAAPSSRAATASTPGTPRPSPSSTVTAASPTRSATPSWSHSRAPRSSRCRRCRSA